MPYALSITRRIELADVGAWRGIQFASADPPPNVAFWAVDYLPDKVSSKTWALWGWLAVGQVLESQVIWYQPQPFPNLSSLPSAGYYRVPGTPFYSGGVAVVFSPRFIVNINEWVGPGVFRVWRYDP